MLKRAVQTLSLLRSIQFNFHRKPRDPSVPTQSNVLEPFSINFLHDNPGARYFRKRVGRGPGSGKGKTAGRGHKGHKARQGGGVHPRYEGGQTPLQKRLPKYGRVKLHAPKPFLNEVNLDKINYYVKLGALDPTQTITIKTLTDAGIVKKCEFGVKLLGKGAHKIDYPLNFELTDASKTAIEYVEKAGGLIKLIYRSRFKLKQLIHPHKFPLPLKDPVTPAWKVGKLQRLEKDRCLTVEYTKPKWLIEEQKLPPKPQNKDKFVYPVPIVENSGKIRTRKPKIYRKIDYGLS